MNRREFLIPALLLVAGVAALFAPGLHSSERIIALCVALACATAYAVLCRKPDTADSKTEFKVSVKEISFVHYERAREDRPPASEQVTEIYDKALELARQKDYTGA